MAYELSPDLKDKLKTYSEDTAQAIVDCVGLWVWLSDIANTEEQAPIASDDPQIRAAVDNLWAGTQLINFLPSDARVVPINILHKSNAGFSRKTKDELNAALDRLQSIGVVSRTSAIMSTPGHFREVRYLSPLFLVVDNALAFAQKEKEVFELLLAQIEVAPPRVAVPEVQPAAPGPLRLLRDMRISYGSNVWEATAGSIFQEHGLCRYLLETGAPVAPISQIDIVVCPECNQRFDAMQTQEPESHVLIMLADITFWVNNSTIRRRKGDIESDQYLVKHLLESKAQVTFAAPHEFARCPNSKCRMVFKREAVLGDLTRMQPLQPQNLAPTQAVAIAPATATLAAVETPPPAAPFADPLRQPLGNNLDLDQRLSQRFYPAE